jgi:hypothetical protein
MLRTHVAKEAVDGAQSDVAGAGLAAALGFQMLKEGKDAFRCYGRDVQPTGILAGFRQKFQQEFETVTIAAKRMGAEGSLLRQKISEEGVQGAAQHGRLIWLHSAPPGITSEAQA